MKTYPASQLQASGENVGLPDGQMGNSEVGHLNIGAGRIVYQDLVKINMLPREYDHGEPGFRGRLRKRTVSLAAPLKNGRNWMRLLRDVEP